MYCFNFGFSSMVNTVSSWDCLCPVLCYQFPKMGQWPSAIYPAIQTKIELLHTIATTVL